MTAGPEHITLAVTRLRSGGLVAFPTETVYGLGADALNPRAIDAVFALKGRPANNPLIVHVADEAIARSVVASWPADAATLARRFWPGPLTLVLPKAAAIPDSVSAGGPTVGVRCPAHDVALSLLAAFGGPLVGPSANPSGRTSPTTAQHVRDAFAEDQVLVLDGGPCRAGIESTVLALTEAEPRILRLGVISADQIAAVLGRPVASPRNAHAAPAHSTTTLPAPGQLPVHYAPATRAVLIDAADLAESLARAPGPVVVLSRTAAAIPPPHTLIPMPADAAGYAARLYAALREADALRPALIAIERPPASGPIWDAIADRLARATS